MRENKFKILEINNKIMSTAYSLTDLFLNCDGGLFYGHLDCPDINSEEEIIYLEYTGLKDKNSKEIYEGDIVKIYNGPVGEVIFFYGAWQVQKGELAGGQLGSMDEEDIEVIGNIYENPELIK